MSNLLKNNAYHILGLDTSATQRDIQKRSKEAVKFLQIGDTPEYEFDLPVFENFRTENAIKESVQKLTSPKKRITEYFFWFQIADDIDNQAVGILRNNLTEDAIRVWEQYADSDSMKALFYKKNLAILYCILLYKKHNDQYLKASLKIWHDLINSTKFWNAFLKIYKLNDELNTDREIISDFQKQCSSYLADLYTELCNYHKNDKYIFEFTKMFNIRGEKTEKVVMAPIFEEMTDVVEKLEAMKVAEDNELDKEEAEQIKQFINKIQACCNKLIDLGLYDDSQSKTIRDRAAAAIRSIVLDIHNSLDDIPKAEQLLKIALQFVGTSGMKQKLEQDLDTFEENKKNISKLGPILDLVQEKKYVEAIELIDKTKEENKDNDELIQALNNKKKEVVTMHAVIEYVEAKKMLEADNFEQALPLLEKSASIIYGNIDLFDVNKEIIDSWLETIKGNLKILTSENATKVDEVHNNMLKQLDETFDERWEQLAMKVLINSHYHIGLSHVIKKKKAEDSWGWVWSVVFFIIIYLIFKK